MKVHEALAGAARRLASVSNTPMLDAELLMAHALHIERQVLLLSYMDADSPGAFEALVRRREQSEPVAYIIGRRAFWTIELAVAPGVLIPRPDSETLIEAAVAHFGKEGPRTVLDLGTGSGALLLAALDQWPQALGLGVDTSRAALAIARANAGRLGLSDRARFSGGDWAEGIAERFDLVLCNPPYVEAGAPLARDVVEWEPHEALFAPDDGLGAFRRLAPSLRALLEPQGLACIEVGAGQAEAAAAIFEREGFTVSTRDDLAGIARCLELRP